MSGIRKIFSVFAAMILTMAVMCIQVGALGMEDVAVKIKSGAKKSFEIENSNDTAWYEITLSKKGELYYKVRGVPEDGSTMVELYDSDGNVIYSKGGEYRNNSGFSNVEDTVELNRGTYYIGVYFKYWARKTGKGEITVSYPSGSSSSTVSSSGTYPAIFLSYGDSLDLGIVSSGKVKTNVTVTSSKSKIVKVSSSGVLNAVGKGTSVITIEYGSKTVKLAVVVE